MLLNKTNGITGAAIVSALSLICLLAGTFVPVNTIFFTALAAYLVGYSANKYALLYSGMQLIVCTILDGILNPDKLNWVLYLCFGLYIFGSECIFQKWNRVQDQKKKMRVQLLYNWGLFNVIYIPFIMFFHEIMITGEWKTRFSENQVFYLLVLWILGQIGWFVYDKAYRSFFRMIRERKG